MAEAPAAMRTFLLEAMRRPELRARRCSASPATSPTRRTPSTLLSAGRRDLFRAWRRTTPSPCNPHPSLVGAMSALGSGFDCNSPAEMHAVLLGVAADHSVIYAVSRATRTVFAAAVELGSRPAHRWGFTASSAARFEDARDVTNPDVEVIGEPDRYFTETPFMLAARIFGNRKHDEVREYWIDDGFYGKLSCFSMILARTYTTIVSCKFNGFSASVMKTYLASSA
ncbi:hypothetical protein HU200_010225 [Digitaria exilis]|uniref:Orn/DAP/Arg decarboxylase 2 N-terminal domain-containing protein n=1 Tax=Digitaria exilis TaxID=1010633 RepID=A0A835FHZ3_9POAL|nr:hypothetical protein HU200_010225 [Digitaria exilis]